MPTDWLSSINKHWLKTFCFTLNLYYSYIMAYVRGHFELQIDEKMAVGVSVSSVIIQRPFLNVWLHRRCAARRRLLLARYTEGGRFYSSLHDSDCVRG